MHCNLLIPLDAEASKSVSGLGLDGGLVSEILEHLCCLSELITRLTSAQIKNEFLHTDLSHFIVELVFLLL